MPEPNPEAQQAAEQVAETTELGDFQCLLHKEFKPKTDKAREAISEAVQTLAGQALQETTLISDDVVRTVESMIALHCRDIHRLDRPAFAIQSALRAAHGRRYGSAAAESHQPSGISLEPEAPSLKPPFSVDTSRPGRSTDRRVVNRSRP